MPRRVCIIFPEFRKPEIKGRGRGGKETCNFMKTSAKRETLGGKTMAKIKHIAIRTSDVEKTVAFYKEVFELKQVGRGLNGIYLSDGHINLAILKYQPEKNQEPTKLGVDHLGFMVEDVDGTLAKLSARGGKTLTDR